MDGGFAGPVSQVAPTASLPGAPLGATSEGGGGARSSSGAAFARHVERARGRQARLHEACVELEATLWSGVFRQMDTGFAASRGGGVFEDQSATRSFREMLDTERGREMARSRSGLAELLYAQLTKSDHAGKPAQGGPP